MAIIPIPLGGGETDTSMVTAGAGDVLAPKVIVGPDGEPLTGTMPNRGAVSQALNCGGSYAIPAGYHNGSGKVTANSLASQTAGTATAARIQSGYTAWVGGSKLTGTLAIQSAISFSAAARSYNTIRISWKNPAKGPFQGVKIRMATGAYPGTSGGTLKYTGTGSSSAAGATSYVDITGLSENTQYYFTCFSYVDNLGNGTSANVTAKTSYFATNLLTDGNSWGGYYYVNSSDYGSSAENVSITVSSSAISFTTKEFTYLDNVYYHCIPSKSYDFSKYKYAYFTVKQNTPYAASYYMDIAYFELNSTKKTQPTSYSRNDHYSNPAWLKANSTMTVKVDLSSMTGVLYPLITLRHGDAYAYVNVTVSNIIFTNENKTADVTVTMDK